MERPDVRPAVEIRGLTFAYSKGPPILDIPDLIVPRGERVFLYGPSGSGKTTLLGILAGVLSVRTGSVEVLGHDLTRLSGARRDRFRARHVGYIFQMFNLIPYLSVLENITLPCRLNGERRRRVGGDLDSAAREVARRLGILDQASKKVTELSVGQQQRVAAARALLGAPELVIADEPTSSIDAHRRESFLELLFACCGEVGTTLIFVSHDQQLMRLFDRGLSLPEINRVALRE